MRTTVTLYLLAFCLTLPGPAIAEDAQSIIDRMLELQDERRKGVNRYTIEQSVMGQTVKTVFERVTVTAPDGETVETFQVKMPENLAGVGEGSEVSREEFDNMAENAVHTIHEVSKSAELVGTEDVDGNETFHLVASDLERTESFEAGASFTLNTINVWIDSEEYVPWRMTMDGMINTDGEDRPMNMEVLHQDYRQVPGSKMYESYRQVMRMDGQMSEETRAQVEQARLQLEEFEKQMAQMPESQRNMMMNMMGDQIEMMRKLAEGEGLEIVTDVVSITVE